jgi:hypothetical protein
MQYSAHDAPQSSRSSSGPGSRPGSGPPRPAGTGLTSAPFAMLSFDDVEDTAPSTPYPALSRPKTLGRWLGALRAWIRHAT